MVKLLQAILIFNYNDHYTIYNNFFEEEKNYRSIAHRFCQKKLPQFLGRIIVFFRGYGTYFKGFFSYEEKIVIAY